MGGLNLIMPMAGRGSRFLAQAIREPKPLIDLNGKPFFWWAAESVRRAAPVKRMIFVILQEHTEQWQLDRCIRDFYPDAEILIIPEVTAGSAETAALAIRELQDSNPFVVNDCDHAFLAPTLGQHLQPSHRLTAGTLLTFRSESPNYSYAQLNRENQVTGTVEKQAVSPFAIAGCYLFSSPELFLSHYAAYAAACPYPELFLSGVYNQILHAGLPVDMLVLQEHFAFGTPEEYANVRARLANPGQADSLASWS